MTDDVRLVAGILVLVAVTALVLRAGRVPVGWAPSYAVARGAGQLVIVGLALGGVFRAPALVVAALGVMLGVAVFTASRRLRATPGATPAVLLALVAGAGTVLTSIFVVGMLPFSTRNLVALGGILIGGTMLSVSIAGRNLERALHDEREEIEAWLALGATSRQATARLSRRSAAEALVPVIDQTRTTGLVTLPGAFIGALLGGASPADAARFQIVVLAGLIAAQSIATVVLMARLGAPEDLPA